MEILHSVNFYRLFAAILLDLLLFFGAFPVFQQKKQIDNANGVRRGGNVEMTLQLYKKYPICFE